MLRAHGERLYRLLVRLTLREDVAEDLLQELALKLSQAAAFASAAEPYAYARRAAVNLAFSWIRTRRRTREQQTEHLDAVAHDPPPWSGLVNEEDVERLIEQMARLADRDRLILVMRYFDDAAYAEIASMIGGTPHQARALCHKAIGQLRKAMIEPGRAPLPRRAEVKP